jgi:hypothetical protein
LLFFQWRIGFIRRRLRIGALGFAQRGFLVSLSLFLLAPSTCRPRSLGSISSVIWLKCHCVSRWLITHLSALYKHVAMPLKRHVCASNYNDRNEITQGIANMEEHETRRKIIREWMALPKEKRQTEEQVAAFAKKAAQQNEFHRSRRDPSQKFRRDPYQKLMGWLLPRAGKS